jgi:protein-disulfide isomerase
MMKRFFGNMMLFFAVLLVFTSGNGHAASPPVVGGQLPDFELSIPADANDKAYLDLPSGMLYFGRGAFKVPQIKAPVVILQVFSMYCPHCQGDAPNVNALYRLIENTPATKGKVKIIGIGAGNNPYEVGLFKKHYQIPFALFPDANFSIHKKLGEVRTPYFIVIRIQPDGSHKVVYSRLASFGDPNQFLNSVVKLTNLK